MISVLAQYDKKIIIKLYIEFKIVSFMPYFKIFVLFKNTMDYTVKQNAIQLTIIKNKIGY